MQFDLKVINAKFQVLFCKQSYILLTADSRSLIPGPRRSCGRFFEGQVLWTCGGTARHLVFKKMMQAQLQAILW